MTIKCTSIVFKNPFEIDLQEDAVPSPNEGEVLVETEVSAISPGSEMLVYRGQLPAKLPLDASIPELNRQFNFPLKYGYASVGRIVDIGRSVPKNRLNQRVFCFYPHQSHYTISQDQLLQIPADIDSTNALFLANMETSVNFLMDGRPIIGERVVIFGQGIVGLLTTSLLAMFPLKTLVSLDRFAFRRKKSLEIGAHTSLDPEAPHLQQALSAAIEPDSADNGYDLVYELSGNPDALNQAIAVAGIEARIVVGSWYGIKKAKMALGTGFHRNRIRLISSQVSSLASEFTGRWSKQRRLDAAWDMIKKHKPADFITHRFDVHQADEAYELLDKSPQEAIQVILTYNQ